ncbi:MAG TPA: alpha/beta hydrolase fold domain-containing protein [Caulobacteraceae bacterium]|nr:alpha/beta hydrolase fold domain-containing protein [Caulobacteraceae bacterium]
MDDVDDLGGGEIDPEIARFVAAVQVGYAAHPDLAARSPAERRAVAERVREPWRKGGPAMARRADLIAPTAARAVPVRLLAAEQAATPRPAMIYLHGGGFTTFSLDTHDRVMREYAARTGAIVIGVDYSLSPEAKFPVALNETVGVVDWLGAESASLGVDPGRIAIGGDSAGANLALASAIVLRDRGRAGPLAAMVLNYGFFDADLTTTSQRRHGGTDKMLSSEELAGYIEGYLGGTPHGDNPLALPLLADLDRLPPSFHVIAECDPLRDADLALVRRMTAAGDRVESRLYRGATHSFLEAVSISAIAERAFAETSAWLRARLAEPASGG